MMLKAENVYSQIYDPNIRKDIKNSIIWRKCYHEDDEKPKGFLYRYVIKFDGLKPVQVSSIKKL